MSKHTLGPWVVRDIPSHDIYVGPANNGGAPSIAICPRKVSVDVEQQKANARLIAAAPLMLEALQAMLLMTEQHATPGLVPKPGSPVALARAAIAAATGSQP